MDKNWLIRTTQNKILGPISKEKLIEFIEKGSLTQSDEVCSGNGYWFYLHEQDLVDLHIVGNTPQGYNPISEGKTVLARKRRTEDKSQAECDATTNSTMVIGRDILSQLATTPDDDADEPIQAKNSEQEKKNQVLPNESDLEFPDLGDEFELPSIEMDDTFSDEQSLSAASTSLIDAHRDDSSLKPADASEEDQFQGKLPPADDLEFPETENSATEFDAPPPHEMTLTPASEKKKLKLNEDLPQSSLVTHRPNRLKTDIKDRRRNETVKVLDNKQGRSDRYLFVIFFIMMSLVVYAIYFYYSKIASQRSFNATEEVSALFISSVLAQDSSSKKKSSISPIDLNNISATAAVSTVGARISFNFTRAEVGKCPVANSFQFLYAVLASDLEASVIEKELSNCHFNFSRDELKMLQLAKMPKLERRKWVKSSMNKLPEVDQAAIKTILLLRENKAQQQIIVDKFNEYVEFLSRSPSESQLYRFNEELLFLCQQNVKGSILAQLLEVLVALSIDNQALAKKNFSQILQRNLMQIVFFLDPSLFINKQDKLRYQNNMRRAMVYIFDHLEDKIFAQLAINYFAIFDQSEATLRLIKNGDADWSLSDIRKILQKPIYGEFFFLPWFYILQSRAQEQEVELFVETYLTPDVVSRLQLDLIPVIAMYFPKNEIVRQRILEIIKQNYDARSVFHRFQLIESLKIPYLAKGLVSRPTSLRGATFQLERNFYRELLEFHGIADFSLFNLVRLGEQNSKLLWWLIL